MALEKDKTIKSTYHFGKGEVVFDTVNEFRLVSPETTAGIALAIQKWADANLPYPFDINSLIPENVVERGSIQKYSEFYVESSYKLLKPKKNLNFGEALFILLGLDPYELALPPFHNFNPEKYQPFNDGLSLESVFFITKQYQTLLKSTYLINRKISSENLIKLAKVECFFNEEALHLLSHHDSDNYYKINNDKRKESTIKNQKIITTIAKTIIKNDQEIKKQILASDINKKLKEEHGITHLKDSTIERQYLNNYKALKGIT